MSFFDRQVYVVDDDAALRNTVRRILTSTGILTEEYDSAEAFLSARRGRLLGCVLLDVSLPGMSGIELLRQIRNEAVPHPVIMMSGFGDIPLAVEAVKAGAVDFVQKPFRAEHLRGAVENALKLVQEVQTSRTQIAEELTHREKEALLAFTGGSPNKIVAKSLGLSIRTVEKHRANIIKKLGVDNLTQALSIAKDGFYHK